MTTSEKLKKLQELRMDPFFLSGTKLTYRTSVRWLMDELQRTLLREQEEMNEALILKNSTLRIIKDSD